MTDSLETTVEESAPANDTRNFDAALRTFVGRAQTMLDEHRAKHFPNNGRQILSTMIGPKYVRVVVESEEKDSEGRPVGRSVYCFIEIASGNVLKSASWKQPAKGPRGNIYAENPIAGVTAYGAAYAR